MKKTAKKLMALLLAAIFVFEVAGITGMDFGLTLKAEAGGEWVDPGDFEEDFYRYSVYNGEAYLCKCDSLASGNIVIPSTLGGYPVVQINDYAFENNDNITSVVVPDTVKYIGKQVFCNCDSLEDVTLPDGLLKIGYRPFDESAYENNLDNWENNAIYIGKYLICVDYDLAEGVYSIKPGTELIADNAFGGCSKITGVNIPDSVKYMGEYVFYNCKQLVEVSIPKDVKIEKCYALFKNCHNLKKVEFPSNVTAIANSMFSECYSLEEIDIPHTVKNIEAGAFSGCTSLKRIEIPEGVESIESETFAECTLLSNVALPNSLKSIGFNAFYSCDSLTNIVVPNGVEIIEMYAFHYCENLEFVHIPASVIEMYKSFEGSSPYICSDTADCYAKTYAEENGLTFKVCDGHGVSQPEPHSHSYELINTVSPTCTVNGAKIYVCECGEEYRQAIQANGHVFGDWITEKEATATENGVKIRICSICGETEEKSYSISAFEKIDYYISDWFTSVVYFFVDILDSISAFINGLNLG